MNPEQNLKKEGYRIALVLQGGGALGAYQGGVFQALHENGLTPDWVVGTSIGAVNGAIIAGNEPSSRLYRLQEFWDSVAHRDWLGISLRSEAARRANTRHATFDATAYGIPGFYQLRPFNPFALGLPVEPELASFYDVSPLRETLLKLVDFGRLAREEAIRLTVSAMQVTNGELVNFDSAHQPVGVDHVIASGALPPGFPPIRIDGKLYWDGGLYTNTPLEIVLDDEPLVNTICFMVDLWRNEGPEPRTLQENYTRQREVLLASRSNRHIEEYRLLHNLRNAVCALNARLPEETREEREVKELAAMGCGTTMHLVRLSYSGQDWQEPSKHLNFSQEAIQFRWDSGYRDGLRAVAQAAWLAPQPPHIGVVVHDLTPEETKQEGYD